MKKKGRGKETVKMKMEWQLALALGVASLLSVPGCGKKEFPGPVPEVKIPGKILIVYYSQSGTRNTATVAGWIRQLAGGDVFEIVMEHPYSGNYFSVLRESKKHMDEKTDPEIRPFPGKISDYDVIFIGSPIWYGTFAPPVGTFLHQHDFTGKTVVPFCTHGGGGAGSLREDVAQAAKGANVLPELVMKGHNIAERVIGRGTADKCSPPEVAVRLNEIFRP